MTSSMDSQMKDGFGQTVPAGSPGTYNKASSPFDQPGDGTVFQQKIYDQIKNGASNSGRQTTMDGLGKMGTIPSGGYSGNSDD